tara:strand:+ start:3354 stop:4388 length:1035 start_codon:yes stop_codon:yes gene_type:complete
MNLPITSRIKRSPFKEKDPKNKKAKASSIVEGGTTTKNVSTTTTSENPKLTSFKERCGKFGGKNSAAAAAAGCVWSDDAKDPDPITTTVDKEVVVKKPDEIISTDLYEERKQDVLNPAEVNRFKRATNMTTRNVRRTGDKQDKIKRSLSKFNKYDTDKDGKISDKERSSMSTGFLGFGNKQKKYDKLKRRETETSQEMEQFSSAQENQARSQKSGRRWKSQIKTDDELKTKGQYTDKEQLQMAKDKLAVERAKLKAAQNQKVTTSSGGQAANAVEVTEEVTPLGAPLQYKKSSNKMRSKSPAKKALKGSQNQLPQHLQAAIKAAPGKMNGSPYKMKGSMFKKKY